jgi:antitoxin component YwqK of YwqJK toxin-antitoxin module
MKGFGLLLCLVLISCAEANREEHVQNLPQDKIVYEDGMKTVFFENSESIRFRGEVNKDSLWNGRVTAFNRDGTIQSTSNYTNGLKYGNHQVFYSNGSLRYTGEFRNDTMIGKWIFYDQNGNFEREKDYY